MAKKYSFNWTKIENKKGHYRWVLLSLLKRKKVIPKCKYKIEGKVRRYTQR
jgi:hypothetical protein